MAETNGDTHSRKSTEKAKGSGGTAKKSGKPRTYHLIAVELDDSVIRRKPDRPHIYLAKTVVPPDVRLAQLQRGAGPDFAVGHYRRLIPLPVSFRPTKDSAKADEFLKKNIEAFVRLGHAVNNLPSSLETEWVVYVLALSEEGKEKLMRNKDQSRKRGYIYVGQTSNPLEVRLAQHRGEQLSRTGRHLGARPTRERTFEVLHHEVVYSARHALEREQELADAYECKNYLVDAGEATPRKRRRKARKATATSEIDTKKQEPRGPAARRLPNVGKRTHNSVGR
jgi:hypothetical protein